MIQIKLIQGGDLKTLNDNVNETLAGIPSDAIKEPIKFDFSEMVAIIQFELIEEWKNRMCAECRYFDDGGEPSAVSGLCQEHGWRRRFNNKACECFKDVRGAK